MKRLYLGVWGSNGLGNLPKLTKSPLAPQGYSSLVEPTWVPQQPLSVLQRSTGRPYRKWRCNQPVCSSKHRSHGKVVYPIDHHRPLRSYLHLLHWHPPVKHTGGARLKDQCDETDRNEPQHQPYNTDPWRQLIKRDIEHERSDPSPVLRFLLASVRTKQLPPKLVHDCQQNCLEASKEKHPWSINRLLLSVDPQGGRCRNLKQTQYKRCKSIIIHATTHTRNKWDNHPATTLAHPHFITWEPTMTWSAAKWNRVSTIITNWRQRHAILTSPGTTIEDQVRIVRPDWRGGSGKDLAMFNKFQPRWTQGV